MIALHMPASAGALTAHASGGKPTPATSLCLTLPQQLCEARHRLIRDTRDCDGRRTRSSACELLNSRCPLIPAALDVKALP